MSGVAQLLITDPAGGIELDDAREQLGRVAEEQHLGFDGLWSLRTRG